MKTLLLLSLCVSSFSVKAQTIFAPVGAIWNFYRDGEPPSLFNTKLIVEKDTFYQGHHCTKVIGENRWLSGTKNILAPIFFYTSGDTVIYYHDTLKAFTPLYIFNTKVGDTLTMTAPPKFYPHHKTFQFLINKVDTNIIDGIPLRRVHYTNLSVYYPGLSYTERIGGYRIGGLLEYTGPTTADHTLGIRCYKDGDIDEKFVTDKWDCDYVPTDIAQVNPTQLFTIFPNPTREWMNIQVDIAATPLQARVMSMDGSVVLQTILNSKETQLYLGNLANGIYFLELKNEEIVYHSKIIIGQ